MAREVNATLLEVATLGASGNTALAHATLIASMCGQVSCSLGRPIGHLQSLGVSSLAIGCIVC